MLIGARISSRAPGGIVRAALVIVLLASALKLLDVPTPVVGAASAAAVLVAVGLAVFRRVTAGRDARVVAESPGDDDREKAMAAG